MSIIIISIFFALLFFFIFTLFRKIQFYDEFARKISWTKPLKTSQLLMLRNYFLLFIFERLINSFSVTVLSVFSFNGMIPVLVYMLKVLFVYRYLERAYHPAHRLRLYLTYSVGVVVQVLLVTRRMLL